MFDYIIAADNMGDLPDDYCEKHDLKRVFLSILMDGVTYDADNRIDDHVFYDTMRAGSMPVTSQITPEKAKNAFKEYLKEKKKIIFFAVSSGISGTYSSVYTAAQEVMEEEKDCQIAVVDSLCASLGEGLLIHKALLMRERGASFDEVVEWVESHKKNVVHMFTVDDLFHLHRGGRVSKATAIVGSLVNIKPVLHVDDEGRLINISKVRGRKKSLIALADAVASKQGSWAQENIDDCMMISHGDCPEDAKWLAEYVKERYGIQEVLISYVGATIGAHTGPGVVAFFFMGDER